MTPPLLPGFRTVPRTGVIYVSHRAMECGFTTGDSTWANLGQGAPETGMLPGGIARIDHIDLEDSEHEYTPIAGLRELREAVAHLYNTLYRSGKSSKYTAENVAISGGGRLALARVAASLSDVNMGHFIPDYTAYEELLTMFKAFTPIPILLSEERGYRISPAELKQEILGRGLSAILLSNPTNPTGQHVRGAELAAWTEIARECETTLIVDEFYSHYVYDALPTETTHGMVSAAAHIDDVESDPVVIIDGLTKNWRYPGWRISWTLGPKSVIESLASAGSFLDGGAPHPLQRATVPLLDPALVVQDCASLQRHFHKKRDYVLSRLQALGIRVPHPPRGSFYCWADLSALPAPLNDGMAFFEAGLRERVITVPGMFFDVNPGKRRKHSRYEHACRLSFGPDLPTLERGLDAIARIVTAAKDGTSNRQEESPLDLAVVHQ
ncbi:MAG: pyridoxal phosphate-dependent aminotransferase [Candidatus Peregrinibacteria bacterium]|nr:pyridoxal phosphate-dependent aminotransferase [Candidatus Peregrinibacteria bacterium]